MKRYIMTFKALSDPTRLRMVHLLVSCKMELCVCEFVDALEESQYKVSRHLRALENAGLIRSRKEGRWVYYGLESAEDAFGRNIYKVVKSIDHKLFAHDLRELQHRLDMRSEGKCLLPVQKTHLLSGR